MKKHIALIGMVGNLKSAVAGKLASRLGMMVMDCQDYVSYSNSMTAEQLIKETNVTYFKKQVSKTVSELEDLENMVFCSCDLALLSVGDLKKLRQNCYVVHLYASTKVVQSKYSQIKPISPLLAGEKLDKLNNQSQKRYPSYCNFALQVGTSSVDGIVDKILAYLQTC